MIRSDIEVRSNLFSISKNTLSTLDKRIYANFSTTTSYVSFNSRIYTYKFLFIT